MYLNERKWVIVNTTDFTDDMNAYGHRRTIDGSKCLFKWDGDTPSCFDGMITYTHSEILTELAKSEWTGE